MDERPRQRRFDIAVVVLLIATAWVLFVRHAGHLVLTIDGYTMTFLIDQDLLRYFGWVPIKEPGRQFVGVAHRLCHDLFGGSVASYNRFQLAGALLSAVGTFAIVRMLLPARPHLAAAAAILKLTWPFNHSLMLNLSLPVIFGEVLVVAAAVALLVGATRDERSRGIRITAAAAMVPLLFIATGTYQTLWPLIVLFPPLAALMLRPRGARMRGLLITWYAVFTAGMILSLCNLAIFPNNLPDASPPRILGNWLSGIQAVFIDTIWQPAAYAAQNPSAAFALAAIAITITWIALLRPQDPSPTTHDPKTHHPRTHRSPLLPLLALALTIAPLLPPSLKGPALYGTRFGHLAVYGWIMLILLVASAAWASPRRAVRVAGVLLVAYFAGTGTYFWLSKGQQQHDMGDRVFARMISTMDVCAGTAEDTVITATGTRAIRDAWTTTHLHMISDTYATYWITDPAPTRTAAGAMQAETWMALDRTKDDLLHELDLEDPDAAAWERWARQPVPMQGEPVTQTIEASHHAALWWNPAFSRFTIDPRSGGATRLASGGVSRYGSTLYPDAARLRGGSIVNRDRYTVLARTGPEPETPRAGLDWYDPACGLIASADADERGVIVVANDPLLVHVAVPEGDPRQVTFTAGGSATLAVQTVQTADPQRKVFPLSPTTARHASPPLPPGVHVLRLRLTPATAANGPVTLEAFALEPVGDR